MHNRTTRRQPLPPHKLALRDMITLDVSRRELEQNLKLSPSLISHALKGRRPAALARIREYLKSGR